ncbi:CBS domain-containing protein [Dendrosporobacter sp. 1207_IL3150]|uniref:CBS domain-containing protein n=1 Tax=Dendrosporobacter sp. 1207_IL3150 TaxID=3084054 RepID=UPI002FD98138
MFIANRMTANPITISPLTTVADASELMRKNKFRRLPVVDKGKIVGIVTDRDLMEVSPSPATTLSIFELNYLLAKMQVKDIMTKEVVTIASDATVEEAALVMYNTRVGGLPVLDSDGKVVGIITETDIFKCFVDIMGLPSGKTRITIDVTDKIGVIHEITEVFAEMGVNISSMATYTLPGGQGELVIRADADHIENLLQKLSDKGYPVNHAVKIG